MRACPGLRVKGILAPLFWPFLLFSLISESLSSVAPCLSLLNEFRPSVRHDSRAALSRLTLGVIPLDACKLEYEAQLFAQSKLLLRGRASSREC